MAIVQKLAARKDFYLANSINSIRIEGQKTISIEIVQQFDWEVPELDYYSGGQPWQCVCSRLRLPNDVGTRYY